MKRPKRYKKTSEKERVGHGPRTRQEMTAETKAGTMTAKHKTRFAIGATGNIEVEVVLLEVKNAEPVEK